MIFTTADKALLDRCARHLDGEANKTGWEQIADSRKRKAAKEEFDRLTRDARDLRMMGKRMLKGARDEAKYAQGPKATSLPLEASNG